MYDRFLGVLCLVLLQQFSLATSSLAQEKADSAKVSPALASTCNYQTPLKPGILGSPSNLIQLPNRDPGVTELAAIMRYIYDSMKARRNDLIAGKPAKQLTALSDFSKISCAWPTDADTRSPIFDSFARANQLQIKHHEETPNIDTFNAVVSGCLSCHQQYCPGPIGAIEGLFTKVKVKAISPRSCESSGPEKASVEGQ